MRPGMVHDSNTTVLSDSVRALGGEPVPLGIVRDAAAALDAVLRSALSLDMLLLSGGTSKGAGDVSYRAVGRMGTPGIVAHGVALKPGKPLYLAAVDREGTRPLPVAVLPGFPTSSIFTFHEFLAPVLRRMSGLAEAHAEVVSARLPVRVNSERGRTEYLLVCLVAQEEGWTAYPMGKGSGSVTTFSRADGFLVIPRQTEDVERDSPVQVHLLAAELKPADLVVIGSHCTGLDYLLGEVHGRGFTCKVLSVGSTAGLEAAKRGECDLAGVHLLDPRTNTYNAPFLTPDVELIAGYQRMQGVVHRKDDTRFDARKAYLADAECVMVNRNRGSGTRVLIDRHLGPARPAGYLTEARSHNAVCAAVAQGRADWGIAIEPVAEAMVLGFLPLCEEHYDFAVPKRRKTRPAVRALEQVLGDPVVRAELARRGFRCEGRPA